MRTDDDEQQRRAVSEAARPGDSAAAIAERLGEGWHRVKVQRVVTRMGRAIGRPPADTASAARRKRAGDVAVAYRRRRG